MNRPLTSVSAASPAAGPNPASSQDPTLIGDVGLTTRSMLTKRSGRPRSRTRATADSEIDPRATSLAARAVTGRRLSSEPAATSAEPPARPPRNRYPATLDSSHVGGLRIGRR